MTNRIQPSHAGLLIKLFRTWSAAREIGNNPLPAMYAHAEPFAAAPELIPACESYFVLVESYVGRSLIPECCCSVAPSTDEVALITILRHAPTAGPVKTNRAVPHGMPGALVWAAFSVQRALEESLPCSEIADAAETISLARCPFDDKRIGRAA
ncbi:MAG: hypothetical protein AAGE05_15210 [Pseudomonadota bacterium]